MSACAPPAIRPSGDIVAPADFPFDDYRRALERGEPVYRVDAAHSRALIIVRRGGTLAEAGHDHVVASHDVHGMLAPSGARADLYVPLDRLVVDEPDLRAEAGFVAPIPEAAIAATRVNMLSRVLHADAHPIVFVHATAAAAERRAVEATIAINGVSRSIPISVSFEPNDEMLRVNGAFTIDQTDFGIVPLSLFNGAIQVQNGVEIRFSIQARRVTSMD